MQANGIVEPVLTKAAKQLGISDKVFWSTTAFVPGPPPNPPVPAADMVKRQLDSVLTTQRQALAPKPGQKPAPKTAQIGGRPLRDQELLRWATDLVEALFLETAPASAAR